MKHHKALPSAQPGDRQSEILDLETVAQAEALLEEAADFMTAARDQQAVCALTLSHEGVSFERDLLREQALEKINDVHALLADPELLTNPVTARKRSALILRAAHIASGMDPAAVTSKFLTLLLGDPDEEGVLPSRTEVCLATEAIVRRKAEQHLQNLRDLIVRAKEEGDERVITVIEDWGNCFEEGFDFEKWAKQYYRKNTSWWQRFLEVDINVPLDDFPMAYIIGWRKIVLQEVIAKHYQLSVSLSYEFEYPFFACRQLRVNLHV